jgi:hypothetical protein
MPKRHREVSATPKAGKRSQSHTRSGRTPPAGGREGFDSAQSSASPSSEGLRVFVQRQFEIGVRLP